MSIYTGYLFASYRLANIGIEAGFFSICVTFDSRCYTLEHTFSLTLSLSLIYELYILIELAIDENMNFASERVSSRSYHTINFMFMLVVLKHSGQTLLLDLVCELHQTLEIDTSLANKQQPNQKKKIVNRTSHGDFSPVAIF